MPKRKNKLTIVVEYVKEKHPDITIIEDAIGLVDTDQWMILAKHKDVNNRLLVIVDMKIPRKIIILPINDTVAYWSARYVLAMNPAARRYANECAREYEQTFIRSE